MCFNEQRSTLAAVSIALPTQRGVIDRFQKSVDQDVSERAVSRWRDPIDRHLTGGPGGAR
jgi:hypothetical protein